MKQVGKQANPSAGVGPRYGSLPNLHWWDAVH
jgi:hypothetical protein